MAVKVADINRIAAELQTTDPVKWCEREEIDLEAALYFMTIAFESLAEIIQRKNRPTDVAIRDIIMNSWMIGWECGREYGRGRRE